jgi:Family of unknown function (DUF6054)
MAKIERNLRGNFDEVLSAIEHKIMNGSISASFEEGSDYQLGEVRCAVRVFERYSWIGSSRVSLNLNLIGVGQNLFLSAISSGGSQAVFFKINTFGENAFLSSIMDIVNIYEAPYEFTPPLASEGSE